MFIRPWPALALLGLVDCATPRAELPRPSPDPADPGGPEAPISPASKTLAVPLQAPIPLASAPSAPGAALAPADAAAEAPSSYTCPMHPDVYLKQPGNCPKCGMKLVPEKKSPPKKDAPMKAMPMDGMKDMKHGGHP